MDAQMIKPCVAPAEAPEITLTVGVDGQLYCHDITPELLPVLAAMCGDDPRLAARMRSRCVLVPADRAVDNPARHARDAQQEVGIL